MPQDDMKPPRPWREIARVACQETDPQKSAELVQELIKALDAESRKRMERVTPEQKTEGAA